MCVRRTTYRMTKELDDDVGQGELEKKMRV